MKEMKNYGCIVLKSLVWPGAHTLYYDNQPCQIYVGDGLKHEQPTYYPNYPPTVLDDPEEKPTCEEVSIPLNLISNITFSPTLLKLS